MSAPELVGLPTLADRTWLDTADGVATATRQLVAAAFEADNTARQADRDPTQLSMSGLGGCTRAAAYSIAGTPPTDVAPPEDARQAMLGTWIHEHLLPGMAAQAGPDAVVEQPAQLRAAGLVIPGTLDLAMPEIVWDLKSVREWRLSGVRRHGTYADHRVQVMGYALARYQAGYPVRWVAWLYLDRATGDTHIEVEPFTNAAALAVVDRVSEIAYHAQAPDDAPREGHGPGLSFACDRCPWLRRCWGPDATPGEPGAQKSQAATIEGIVETLELYAAAAAVTGPAEKDKDFAKLVLSAVPDGRYGRWILRRGEPGETTDMAEVERLLTEHGIPVPKRPKAGAISVRPAPQEV